MRIAYWDGGALTTLEVISWYIVLWEEGEEGSCKRPMPQQFVAPERKEMRRDFVWEICWRVRIR